MGIGLLIAFFMSHKKIWVHLVEDGNNTRVAIGATANKNRGALEKKIDRIINILSQTQHNSAVI
jgi:cytochrome c biogenesis protein